MLLRLLLSAGLFCGMAAADEGPWARFFNQPATTVPQGTQQALSNALSSAFNPLSLKAPSYPTLAVPDNAKISRLAPLPCSVPLLEYKAPTDKQFFIRHLKPQTTAQDSEFSKPAPSQACK